MGSVYKIVELVGTSEKSWEDAALTAVNAAGESLRDLRIAEVEKLDLQIADDGSVAAFRTKVKLSFKHEVGG
jgi:flavin-binding protein dodecin